MIKKAPYNVEFGNIDILTPPYVISISGTSIQLSEESGCTENTWMAGGLIKHNGIDSEETKQLMLQLNEFGYAFAYDYKSYISPSSFMKELLKSGMLKTSFKEISWKTSQEWCLTEYEYESNT